METEPDTWAHQPAANEGGLALVVYTVFLVVGGSVGCAIGVGIGWLIWGR